MTTFTPKAWLDYPSLLTPTSAAAWKAMEQRVVSYATAEAAAPGVYGYEDFRPEQNPAGANMQVALGLAATENLVWIRDAAGGIYRYQYNGAQLLSTALQAADLTNPRIDRICLTAPASADSIVPQVVVLTGTPTASATTVNLSGAQAVPVGYELIADVVVGAGVTSIVTANISERRRVGGTLGNGGVNPVGSTALPTNRNEALLQPSDALPLLSVTLTPTTHDNFQGAYLCHLAKRIPAATRIRWGYAQGTTPATSNYNVAICDASGRLIVSVGSTAFTGGASAFVQVANTIAATAFEPGDYYVWMGIAALTASSAVSFYGVQGNGTVTAPGPRQNMQKFSNGGGGGVTFPAAGTLAGSTDVAGVAAAYTALPMPIFSISEG